ncbi:MAG: flagellar biosynthesis anti-sigma factor FlgM [Pseudomonadota bacterium]
MANDIKGVPPSSLTGINDVTGSRRVAAEKQSAGSTPESGPERSGETVELTDGAKLLQRVESELASAASVDTQRVSELKDAIANGNYQVDDQAIAEKLLRSDGERK